MSDRYDLDDSADFSFAQFQSKEESQLEVNVDDSKFDELSSSMMSETTVQNQKVKTSIKELDKGPRKSLSEMQPKKDLLVKMQEE